MEIKFLEVLLPEPWGRLEPRWRDMGWGCHHMNLATRLNTLNKEEGC